MLTKNTITLALTTLMISSVAAANFGHHDRGFGPRFHVVDVEAWHHGHWYHGDYAGRFGWWFIVGNSWHFYSQPVYPYPDPTVVPVYVVQVPVAAPAPVAVVPLAPPAVVVTTVPAPNAVAATTAASVPAVAAVPAAPTLTQSQTPPTPVQVAHPEIVGTPQPEAAQASAQTYYCASPQGYYPAVASCPSGWFVSPAAGPK